MVTIRTAKHCLLLALAAGIFAGGCQQHQGSSCLKKAATAGRPDLLRYYENHRDEFKAEELLAIAVCYAQERQYAKAKAVYQEYVQALPLNPRGWRGLGNVDLPTGQAQSAITNYSKALSLGDTESIRLLAAAYYSAGQFGALRAMADKLEKYALRHAPDAPERFEALDFLLIGAIRVCPPDSALFHKAIELLKQSQEKWPEQTKRLVKQAEQVFQSEP